MTSACACFGERGYGSTTNQDIADGAGLTSAAIYQYFDSKKALYLEAVRNAHRLILPHFREAIATPCSVRDGFCKLARAYAVVHKTHPLVTPLLSALPVEIRRHAEIAEAMRSEPREFTKLVIDLTARGIATGEVDPEMAEGVVSMILACTMGLSLHASLMGDDRFETAVESFARLLEGTLLDAPRTGALRTKNHAPRAR